MNGIWRGCAAILLLIAFILSLAPTPSEGQQRRSVTQNQIERALKRFRTNGTLSYEAKLKQLLDCVNLPSRECFNFFDTTLVNAVANEVLIRNQMRERGEECTSDMKYVKAFDGANLGNREEYLRFQDELLNSGLTFCNPFKHLSCSPQKKCECGPHSGTVLKSEVNPDVCTLIPGGNCLKTTPIFDPFNGDNIIFTAFIPPLQCSEGEPDCSSLEYSSRPFCVNTATVELDKKLVNYFKDPPRLSFGDPCNLEHHKEYLKSPVTEWKDYMIRAKKLEEIMGAKTQFCDLRRILVCGNSSKKCECIKPAFYDEKTKNCTFKHPHEACAKRDVFRDFAKSLTSVPSREVNDEGYTDIRNRECKAGCAFIIDQVLCLICRDFHVVGRNCDKNLTLFLSGDPRIALPMDEPDWGKQIDLITELSEKAKELEKFFVLEEGSPCDMEGDLEGARAIRRIKNLDALRDGTVVVTKEYYRETIRFTDMVIHNYSTKGFCKYPMRNPGPLTLTYIIRPDLICGPNATDSKCYKTTNEDYLEILRKRLIPFQTLPIGQPCRLGPNRLILSAKQQLRDPTEFYQFLIVRLQTHFVNKTQFCNTTAGLECILPSKTSTSGEIGKCGRNSSEETKMNITMEKKNSGDLRVNPSHSIFVSFLVVVLFSFY